MEHVAGMCCIAGCNFYGTSMFEDRLYCYQHWLEEQRRPSHTDCPGCDLCTAEPKCCVAGCDKPGVVTEVADVTKTWCVDHAFRSDRPDENGLTHPTKAQWNAEDTLRAHGEGLAVDKSDQGNLPSISKTVYEQCMAEMEEGRKCGWNERKFRGTK